MKTKKALFPTTLTNESLDCLKQVISHCEKHNLELFILYTYRLISHDNTHRSSSQSIKKELENKATFIFNKIEDELLKNSSINYHFLSEVGFPFDRIIHNIKSLHIDEILLTKNLYSEFEKENFIHPKNGLSILEKPVHLIKSYN